MTDEQQKPNVSINKVLSEFVDHQVKAAQETGHALNALIPPDFRTHSAEAGKEFVTSFKVLVDGVVSVVDHELEKVRNSTTANNSDSTTTSSSGPSTTGKSKVKVEVS